MPKNRTLYDDDDLDDYYDDEEDYGYYNKPKVDTVTKKTNTTSKGGKSTVIANSKEIKTSKPLVNKINNPKALTTSVIPKTADIPKSSS